MNLDPNTKQQLNIDKENSKLLLTPEFIPYRPRIKRHFKLSYLETLIYGFITFFLNSAESNKFYCTNKQLGELFEVGEQTISNGIKQLEKKELIALNYKIRGNGGKIRFISLKYNVAVGLAKRFR